MHTSIAPEPRLVTIRRFFYYVDEDPMNTRLLFLTFCLFGIPLFGQENTSQIAPGAENQLEALLNKPSVVKPAIATSLGRNWFTLELDSHIFTDQASFRQIVDVLFNIEKQNDVLNGKKSTMISTPVSSTGNEKIMDFVSITIGPLGIKPKSPYRASVRFPINTDTRFVCEIRQLSNDSASNDRVKNLITTRYVEEVTINGRKYIYIRLYSRDDVNASIIPGAKNTLEKYGDPANMEALELIIEAAKTR